jgi:hypothetical protein
VAEQADAIAANVDVEGLTVTDDKVVDLIADVNWAELSANLRTLAFGKLLAGLTARLAALHTSAVAPSVPQLSRSRRRRARAAT